MQPLNPNTSPLGTLRSHANAQAGRAQATNRLATGLRINRAADDPAGLISSEQLRAVLAALEAETRASHRTDAVANTADAALAEAASMVSDAKALAVAAANTGALSDAEREALQIEMDSMTQAASRTLERAGFAGERLFDGKTTLRAGEDELTLEDLPPRNLDDVNAQDDPSGAAAVLSAALDSINTMRQRVGSFQSTSLASEQRLAENETIAAASSLSQIRDADYAKEVAEEARFGILEQTTRTAITLALTSNSRALSLLQR